MMNLINLIGLSDTITRGYNMIDLEKYINIYYNGNPPSNIQLFFLEEKEYEKKYKELTKQINNHIDSDYIDTVGYYLHDPKKNIHYILIKKFWDYECDALYILNLFHELSHIETMPKLNLEKATKHNEYIYIGYLFWREYIAQYEAINKYNMFVDEISFLSNKEETIEKVKKLLKNIEDNLYEIILYCEIQNFCIAEIKEEQIELIKIVKEIKSKFVNKEDIKNISTRDFEKMGIIIKKLFDKYYERS